MDDPTLVAAIAANDPRGLDGAYRRYADPLFAYSRSLLGDSEAAADAVHDTFLLASRHIAQLRDPSRLRPWLFAIARNEGMRHLRHRSRHSPLEAAPEPVQESADPTDAVHSAEIASAVRAAMSGLADGSREIAELAIRHGMAASEIAAVLDVPLNHAHAQLSQAKAQLLVSLGALLVARGNRQDCPELAAILEGWEGGELTPLLRKRVNRHIESCAGCGEAAKGRLSPAAVLSGYAMLPFAVLPEMRRTSANTATGGGPEAPRWNPDSGFPTQPTRPRKPPALATTVAGIGLVVALVLGGSAALSQLDKDSSPQGTPRSGSPLPAAGSPEPPSPSPSTVDTSPSAAPRTPSTTPKPVVPLAFTATGTVTCVTGATFTLTVDVTANSTLDTATLSYLGPGTITQNMQVNGKTAHATGTGVSSLPTIKWWVEVKDSQGRTLRGPDQFSPHTFC